MKVARQSRVPKAVWKVRRLWVQSIGGWGAGLEEGVISIWWERAFPPLPPSLE